MLCGIWIASQAWCAWNSMSIFCQRLKTCLEGHYNERFGTGVGQKSFWSAEKIRAWINILCFCRLWKKKYLTNIDILGLFVGGKHDFIYKRCFVFIPDERYLIHNKGYVSRHTLKKRNVYKHDRALFCLNVAWFLHYILFHMHISHCSILLSGGRSYEVRKIFILLIVGVYLYSLIVFGHFTTV
jgi:hypothetical protein